jgi:hypothetical protein
MDAPDSTLTPREGRRRATQNQISYQGGRNACKSEPSVAPAVPRVLARGGRSRRGLNHRLVEIREAMTDLLSDDEYEAWRGMVLRQIAQRVHVPLQWRITLAIGCLGSIGPIALGIFTGSGSLDAGGGAGLVVSAYLWYGLESDYRAKRRLTRATRLGIIERLAQMQLVSETEAAELRSMVVAAFPAEAA